jgi:hypothetical protein
VNAVEFVAGAVAAVGVVNFLFPAARAAFAPEPAPVEVPAFVANPNRVRI